MKKIAVALLLSMVTLFSACGDAENTDKSSKDSGSLSTSSSALDLLSSEDSSSSLDSSIAGDTEHVDVNDDGACDKCSESVLTTFDFYAINDLHGKFADTANQPGVDELTTYFSQARLENENTIIVASGDMWQGSAESNLTQGKIVTDWMGEVGFAAMTLGNHEYDWGEDYIEANAEIAKFPFLAINVYDKETNTLAAYCQPSTVIEQNGVKIGLIGAIGDCYSSISGDKSGGVYFKTGSDLTKLVKEESERLRADGADFILYSIHDGYGNSYSAPSTISDGSLRSYYDIALSDGYVDIVFEAHSHQSYVLRDSKGVYHLQGGGDNDGISHATANINFANGNVEVTTAELVASSEYAAFEASPVVDELMEKYAEDIALAGRVLGYNEKFRYGSELLSLSAQLYYEKGVERWGDDYDIVLGGGFMSVRSPYDLGVGEVLYGDLQMLLPFDNQLVLCSISGEKLRSQFFETPNSRYYIAYGEYGNWVKNNIDPNATYYLVTDTYSSTYAPNGLTEIARYDENVYARDLIAEYIENGGFGQPENIVLTSIPKILEIGAGLDANYTTTEEYFVKGKIISVENTTYGNVTIEDEAGNRLYIYGLYDQSGMVRYDGLSDPPMVGDTVLLKGPIQNFGGYKVEIYHARIYSKE
ncbi:MAG: hypothetical protein IJ393_02050 [Clostridia bacterium]|nr:hypothetical protein [Clostridia bacterium]